MQSSESSNTFTCGLPTMEKEVQTAGTCAPRSDACTFRRADQSLMFWSSPSCHCLPGVTPCTSGPPNLTGNLESMLKKSSCSVFLPTKVLVWFPCLHHFHLPDALRSAPCFDPSPICAKKMGQIRDRPGVLAPLLLEMANMA
eukprot:1158882-Pelagomonas_calceolata.AAC.7